MYIWILKPLWGVVWTFLYLGANYCLSLIDIHNIVMAGLVKRLRGIMLNLPDTRHVLSTVPGTSFVISYD